MIMQKSLNVRRDLTTFLGMCEAALPVFEFVTNYVIHSKRKIRHYNMAKGIMIELSQNSRKEILWWKNNISSSNKIERLVPTQTVHSETSPVMA